MSLYERLIPQAEELTQRSLVSLPSLDEWKENLPERRRLWRSMIGLDPLPERTDLHVTVTGTLDRGHYVVEKLHFQPLPGCYIAANLYRPAAIERPLPAILYACGHSARGKFHYQFHPRWFGEHGYVALVVDPIQVGENRGFHHGTWRNNWWHWYSQGYTPAGVEVWAAMRALDYLQSRPDVDPDRCGITGLSGGGSISWFAGAADERFKVVAPVCQTGTAAQHVRERTVDQHCDCTFWVNTEGWDFPDVAALIAPRPLLVGATTEDVLFRPYAFREVVARARRLYGLYGREDHIQLVDDTGPHGYTPNIRLAVFSWFERHLKGGDRPITEDIASQPEPDDALAVYPDRRPPEGDRLHEVDRFFIATPAPPSVTGLAEWRRHQEMALVLLRATTLRHLVAPRSRPEFESRRDGRSAGVAYHTFTFESDLPLQAHLAVPLPQSKPLPLVVAPLQSEARTPVAAQGAGLTGARGIAPGQAAIGTVEVRGTGRTSVGPGLDWTLRRAYTILGHTLPERQTLDLLIGMDVLRQQTSPSSTVLYGRGAGAALAIYAALADETIDEIILEDPVASHWDAGPEFLGVLRVGDLPHNLALLFPRPISFIGEVPDAYRRTQQVYASGGSSSKIRILPALHAWHAWQDRSSDIALVPSHSPP